MPSNPGELVGKVAIITGGATGLGAEISRQFVREGALVHIADIADEDGDLLVNELGFKATYHHLDVTDEEDWRRAVATVQKRHSTIDILVNNAGIALVMKPLHERSLEEWQQLMSVNITGVFLGTRAVIPAMLRQGSGSIVNMSSVGGLGQWQIMESAYAASKAAVRVLTKTTGTQYAARGIRCNSVHPGPIDSAMTQAVLGINPDVLARRLGRVPMGRLGQPAEVVSAVVFLASDKASYVTGAELAVDGGAVAQ